MDERDLTFKKIRKLEVDLFGIGEQKELDYD
jgi:hypothetical protein